MTRAAGPSGTADIIPGQHACALYMQTDDRADALLPYLSAGMRQGETCFAYVGDPDPSQVVSGLDALAPSSSLTTGQLSIDAAGGPRNAPGRRDVTKIVSGWSEQIDRSAEEGHRTARLAVDASWWGSHITSADELIWYEFELSRLTARDTRSILCLYDLSGPRADRVLDIIKVHPTVYFGGLAIPNPYHLSTDDYLGHRPAGEPS
jgi:hypothetical protein